MRPKQVYVITGGPGFGKSRLIEALSAAGYYCSGEFARGLIEDQTDIDGEILPWKNPKLFQQEVLKRRIAFYESVDLGTIAFADRGIPDQLAFARYKGFGTPQILTDHAGKFRYALQVFVTPPWPAIYTTDHIRKETYEEAVKIHQIVVETYRALGYEIIELPLLPVEERVKFILKTIRKKQKANK